MELVVFKLGDILCGINVERVQEIKKIAEITSVPHAIDYVKGVINLRGQIVTVIDVKKRLGFHDLAYENKDDKRVIIVDDSDGLLGLLVDALEDIKIVDNSKISPALPPNDYYFENIYKDNESLISIINLSHLLSVKQLSH